MYPMARVYNEGFVRQQQHDHLGYPLIYVEWDKDHWAYSGEEDCWVLEAHFDPVEENMADDRFQDLLKGLADLVATYRAENEDEGVPERRDSRLQDEEELTYESILQKGLEDALKGEAFLLFVASNQEYQGRQAVIPLLYTNHKNEDAALLLEAAAADHVSRTIGRLIQENIQVRHDGTPGS